MDGGTPRRLAAAQPSLVRETFPVVRGASVGGAEVTGAASSFVMDVAIYVGTSSMPREVRRGTGAYLRQTVQTRGDAAFYVDGRNAGYLTCIEVDLTIRDPGSRYVRQRGRTPADLDRTREHYGSDRGGT